MANVGIMGAGGWALGLAMTLNRNNHKVTVWSKVKAELDAIRETGQNERSLPGVMIPKEIVLKRLRRIMTFLLWQLLLLM